MTRRNLIVALMAPISAALPCAAAAEVFSPPQLVTAASELAVCMTEPPPGAMALDAMILRFIIQADGSGKDASLAAGAPEWARLLAVCAMQKLKFKPAAIDGEPIRRWARIKLGLTTLSGEHAGFLGISAIGSVFTPPSRTIAPQGTDDCFARLRRVTGPDSTLLVELTVQPDGSVSEVTMSMGSEPWQLELANCILGSMKFRPGTLDGIAVSARISQPITLGAGGGKAFEPELRSTDEELEAAYRTCYPPDMRVLSSAHYTFEVSASGRVDNARLEVTSGDDRLDQAGACIMDRLKFTPMRQGGRNLHRRAIWELLIRPAR